MLSTIQASIPGENYYILKNFDKIHKPKNTLKDFFNSNGLKISELKNNGRNFIFNKQKKQFIKNHGALLT